LPAIVGKPSFHDLKTVIHGAEIPYGEFLDALISFLMVAAAVYFFMVAPMNAWKARPRKTRSRRPHQQKMSRNA